MSTPQQLLVWYFCHHNQCYDGNCIKTPLIGKQWADGAISLLTILLLRVPGCWYLRCRKTGKSPSQPIMCVMFNYIPILYSLVVCVSFNDDGWLIADIACWFTWYKFLGQARSCKSAGRWRKIVHHLGEQPLTKWGWGCLLRKTAMPFSSALLRGCRCSHPITLAILWHCHSTTQTMQVQSGGERKTTHHLREPPPTVQPFQIVL